MGDMAELDEQSMYFNDFDFNYQFGDDTLRRARRTDPLPRWTWNRKKELKMSKINKFYVGAAHIAEAIGNGSNDEWSHSTLESAINHAKHVMERDEKDCAIIVKIVAVLKRESRPIKVQKV